MEEVQPYNPNLEVIKPKKKLNWFMITLIIVIVFVIIGFSLFFIISKKNASSHNQDVDNNLVNNKDSNALVNQQDNASENNDPPSENNNQNNNENSCMNSGGTFCDGQYDQCPSGIQNIDGIDCCLGQCYKGLKTCSEFGGRSVDSSESCSGTTIYASDTAVCCIGTVDANNDETCLEKGGIICGSGTVCLSNTVTASDTAQCCIGQCSVNQEKECNTDSDCDDDNACTIDDCTYDYKCSYQSKTQCIINYPDDCCPSECDYTNDQDCKPPTYKIDGFSVELRSGNLNVVAYKNLSFESPENLPKLNESTTSIYKGANKICDGTISGGGYEIVGGSIGEWTYKYTIISSYDCYNQISSDIVDYRFDIRDKNFIYTIDMNNLEV